MRLFMPPVGKSSSATSESTTNSKHVGDQERTRGFRCLEQIRRCSAESHRIPRRYGDIATADCNSTLPSYNGTDCVAPVDGECVVDAESKWSCVFPNNSDGSKEAEDLSSTLTVWSESSMESPWDDLPWRAPPPLDSPFNAGNRLRRSSELRVK
ncbi:hypothetical protein PC116_g9140 [Phytophthora cactorum]|nr:hypothetical protein PC114_g13521 [Phytophthora cactorum]KAG4242961.1 hypothetical protein PC116_g9140 [Phytophthora cactorum]